MKENWKMKDMLETIYHAEEGNLEEILLQVNQKINHQLQKIELDETKETMSAKEMHGIIEQIEENYGIKMSAYNKAMYKQGFIDGINLMLDCLKI